MSADIKSDQTIKHQKDTQKIWDFKFIPFFTLFLKLIAMVFNRIKTIILRSHLAYIEPNAYFLAQRKSYEMILFGWPVYIANFLIYYHTENLMRSSLMKLFLYHDLKLNFGILIPICR